MTRGFPSISIHHILLDESTELSPQLMISSDSWIPCL